MKSLDISKNLLCGLGMAALLAGCGDKADYPRAGVADPRLFGLVATESDTVFADDLMAGFSRFADRELAPTLAGLAERYQIHRLTADEAAQLRRDYRAWMRPHAPSDWPERLDFRAATLLDSHGVRYVGYFATAPERRGFYLLRIQHGPVSVFPPVHPTRGAVDAPSRLALNATATARRQGLIGHGTLQALGVSTVSRSLRYVVLSERLCGPGVANSGRVFLAAVTDDDEAAAISEVAVPPERLVCGEAEAGRSWPVTDLDFRVGALEQLGTGWLVEVRIAAASLRGRRGWTQDREPQTRWQQILRCGDDGFCRNLAGVPSLPDGVAKTVLVAGKDDSGRPWLQSWWVARQPEPQEARPPSFCREVKVAASWPLDGGGLAEPSRLRRTLGADGGLPEFPTLLAGESGFAFFCPPTI